MSPVLRTSLAIVGAAALTPSAPAGTPVRPSTVSFSMLTTGGNPRPMVVARFNGHPFPMMIHSGASFFAQIRHADAAASGVRLGGGHQRYGIDRDGHVSDLGLDHGTVGTLAVGRSVVTDAPVSIFEIPQRHIGMLGIGWIRRNRVIMDFPHHRALVAPSDGSAQALARHLLDTGYVAIPMGFDDAHERYVVDATINGVARSMVVHTASVLLVDREFARLASVRTGPEDDTGNGPTGTHVPNFALGQPIRVGIGGWTSPPLSRGSVHDIYSYIVETRPDRPETALGGYLGSDFMVRTGAVVDFGSRTLFVRKGRSRSFSLPGGIRPALERAMLRLRPR